MMRKLSRRTLLAVPLLAASAPSMLKGQGARAAQAVGDVPMYRGNPARTGENPGPGLVRRPKKRWQVRLGEVISSSPAVVDGIVYIGSVSPGSREGGALHAVNAADGIELWRLRTVPGDGIFASPAVGDGVVVTGSYDGIVIAAAATTGQELWRFQAANTFYASPALVAGTVYLGDTNGHLYALDAATGEKRWQYTAGQGFERSVSAPAVAEETVYVASASRWPEDATFLLAIDARTGKERWRFMPDGGSHLRENPVVVGDNIYAVTRETALYVVDAETGTERARFDWGTTTNTPLAVVAGMAYIGTGTGDLIGLDVATGHVRWLRRLTDGAALASGPVVTGGVLYVGDAGGRVYAVTAAAGETLWQSKIGTLLSSPAVVGGELFVGSNSGALRVIGGSSTPPPRAPDPAA